MPDFLSALRAEILWARSLDWRVPEPPAEPPAAGDLRLRPLAESQFGPLPEPQTVEAVRAELAARVADYVSRPATGIMLVKVPAGVGKSHGAVGVAQAMAASGGRVLWLGQDHLAWHDLANFPQFDPELWYHWQGILKTGDDGVPMCRYATQMDAWLARGYAAREMCLRVCQGDGWMGGSCPYWQQAKCKRPAIFGQHAHLVFGVPVGKFGLAVVDELPLKAFVRERIVPFRTGILPIHGRLRGSGPAGALFAALADVQWRVPEGGTLEGRALLDIIGPALDDVCAAIETGFWQAPVVPALSSPADVFQAEYFFLHDLLTAATLEHAAWTAGAADWAHRVWATPTALHILGRHGLWQKLPAHVVVLDATADAGLYQRMFQRPEIRDDGVTEWWARGVQTVYAPRVVRQGRIFQIVGRGYSKRALYKTVSHSVTRHEDGRVEESKKVKGLDMLRECAATCAALARQHQAERVGLVTYKDIEGELREAIASYGLAVASRHFYNMRGTNVLQGSAVLFVVGSPTPRTGGLVKLATALDPTRQAPFVRYAADGRALPLFAGELVEYRLTAAALAQARLDLRAADAAGVGRVVGMYADPELRAFQATARESEILQGAHRGRVNIQDIPVYIFTATPLLDEPLDGVFDTPPVGPDAIPWRTWLRLLAWLDTLPEGTRITTADVAAAARVDVDYARNKKWLAAIEQWFAGLTGPERGLWARPELLEKKGRGRPAFTLGRVDKEL